MSGVSGVSLGELPGRSVTLTRADLVRYAGASGDLNPIHWSDRTADEAGLPGVIAHGMLTMGLAAQFVADWAGDPAALVSFRCRFTRPVVVPDDAEGTTVEIGGTAGEPDGEGLVPVTVTAHAEGRAVLGKAVARVRPRS